MFIVLNYDDDYAQIDNILLYANNETYVGLGLVITYVSKI